MNPVYVVGCEHDRLYLQIDTVKGIRVLARFAQE